MKQEKLKRIRDELYASWKSYYQAGDLAKAKNMAIAHDRVNEVIEDQSNEDLARLDAARVPVIGLGYCHDDFSSDWLIY